MYGRKIRNKTKMPLKSAKPRNAGLNIPFFRALSGDDDHPPPDSLPDSASHILTQVKGAPVRRALVFHYQYQSCFLPTLS